MAKAVQQVEKREEYNLANEAQRASLQELAWVGGGYDGRGELSSAVKAVYERADLMKHLRTLEKPSLRYDSMPVFNVEGMTVWINKRVVFGYGLHPHNMQESAFKTGADFPSAVLLTDYEGRTKKNKEYRSLLLLNGDEDNGDGPECSLVDTCNGVDMPTCSFQCLSRFYEDIHNNAYDRTVERLAKGEIKLLDYTSDQRKPLTDHQKKLLKRKNGRKLLKSPEAGYSLVGNEWHRSGTCLFHDAKHDMYIIVGQDEGTYFGCELPVAVATVSEAFEALIPEEARKQEIRRQGEWFILQVDESEVPEMKDCAVQFDTRTNYDETVFLPLETSDSNHHKIITRDGRVSKEGVLYALDPQLEHDEHQEVSETGWCRFVRNTALRSFSQQGVD